MADGNINVYDREIEYFHFLSAGSSVNVYSGAIHGRECVIKELAPVGLFERNMIKRTERNRIVVQSSLSAIRTWHMARARFLSAYDLNRKLQEDEALSPFIVPVHHCVRANGTLYSISFGKPGQPLNTLRSIAAEDILRLGIRIANMTARIHQLGWLVVDIKPSNYILSEEGAKPVVQLTDLDSAVAIRKARRTRKFMCSNETAAPEMMNGEGKLAGTQSDVYSIAAMILNALAKHPLTRPPAILFDERVRPLLREWRSASVEALRDILTGALRADPSERIHACETLANALREVCEMEGIDHEDLFSQRG